MKKNSAIAVSLITYCLVIGCTTPPLDQWVADRGYKFHKDYSSIDTLGWIVQENGILVPNQALKVVDRQRGDLPDITQAKNLTFKIEGKGESQNFLRQLADVSLTEEFKKINSAEIKLVKPYKYEAVRIVPLSTCNNQEMTLVTKVLNTGEMTIKFFDESNNNITGKLTIKGVNLSGKAELSIRDDRSDIGSGLFVGYYPQRFSCRSIAAIENLVIPKGKPIVFGGVDFYYARYRTVQDESGITLPVADVYIAPSGYYFQQGKTAELTSVHIELAQLIAATSLEERLKPLEKELVALAPLAEKAQYLEARVVDLEKYSYNADKTFSQYATWYYPVHGQIPGSMISSSKKGGSPPYSTLWESINEKEKKLQLSKPQNESELRLRLEEQKKIAEQKTAILAKLTTAGPQVYTSAAQYQLIFGGRLSFPGQLPSSAVYVEVTEVTNDNVNIRLQHLVIEPTREK